MKIAIIGYTPEYMTKKMKVLSERVTCGKKTYERYTVKAALTGSRIDAIRALASNPIITDVEAASACFDKMLIAHKKYLPNFFGGA